MHGQPHPRSGDEVLLSVNTRDPLRGQVVSGKTFRIEDWADRVFGTTWDRAANMGNWAAKHYSMRVDTVGLREDNEVVYGKIDGFGHIVHVSEFE